MNNSNKQTPKERLSLIKKSGNKTTATTQIKEILNDHPQFIPGWIELGLAYSKQGDRQGTLATFESALRHCPNNPKIRIKLSDEQLHFGMLEDCRKNLVRLLELAPKNVHGIINLGIVHKRSSEKLAAIALFKRALQLNPQATRASINLAEELITARRFAEAEECLETALSHAPKHLNLLICCGKLETKRQRLDLALQYFQTAIAHHPEQICPQTCQIDTLWALGRYDEANRQLTALCDRNPNDFSVLIYSGEFSRKSGQRNNALKYFESALAIADRPGQELKSRTSVAEELKTLGRLDEALELIEQTIERYPDELRPLLVKGSILQAKSNLTEAAEVYRAILSIKSSHCDARLELAKTYSLSGRIEQAISLLEETYLLLGGRITIFIQLGSLNQALENWEVAEVWYQKACQEYPHDYRGYCKLADLCFLQGDIETAFNLLQTVRSKKPDSAQIALQLIQFQRRLGRLDSCALLLAETLERFPHNSQLLWELCQLNINLGNYQAALDGLDRIALDSQYGLRKTLQLKAEIYLHQYNYELAEECLRKAIALTSVTPGERTRLSTILMSTGRIDEARQELKIATEELRQRTPPGKVAIPLKSHPATIVNEFRINPPLMAELLEAQTATGRDRLMALGRLIQKEPDYFGSALYLVRELRTQGIFEQIERALSENPTPVRSIPRRIVQFWDEPEPPPEVQKICQSWRDRNPGYEYHRFCLDTAITFLEENYDEKVLRAFANCEHPAAQADFFRLAYLSKMGGFYTDADDFCRQSLDNLLELNPELIILQEDIACIGNNFLGCIPGQSIIQTAFERAVENLNYYCNEAPWFTTGPGLLTRAVGSSLAAYLPYTDYQSWPRLWVLTQTQLRQLITQHISLPYKRTDKSWLHDAYQRRVIVFNASSKFGIRNLELQFFPRNNRECKRISSYELGNF